MTEFFDVVDKQDIVVDRKSSHECLEKGLLHRAILVFLVNSLGEIYVQKRASNLSFYPGHWSASVTGHVSSGETYLQAAKREVKEALGIDCELTELGKFQTPKWKMPDKSTEWELITIFEGNSSAEIRLSEETEEGKFMTQTEFKKLIESNPQIFTPDTVLALAYYPRKK